MDMSGLVENAPWSGKPEAGAAPVAGSIVPRAMSFDSGEGIERWWLGGDPVATAWHNSISLCLPRGERLFIETLRQFIDSVPDKLAAEIRAFAAQEASHAREHARLNRAASEAGYELSDSDSRNAAHIARIRQRSPVANLLATTILEQLTTSLSREYLSRDIDLRGAEPEVRKLWLWHAIEEVEHKSVAYDTWLHATRDWSRWRRWKTKALGTLLVLTVYLRQRCRDTLAMLEQDGLGRSAARWRLCAYLLWKPGILRRITPAFVAFLMPGFHPSRHDDRALIAAAERELPA